MLVPVILPERTSGFKYAGTYLERSVFRAETRDRTCAAVVVGKNAKAAIARTVAAIGIFTDICISNDLLVHSQMSENRLLAGALGS